MWCGLVHCFAVHCGGSAFPCVKIGYRLFEITSEDVATQILFAGCRFTLAVFSRWSDHDHLRTFVWRTFSDSFRKRHGNACLSGTCFGGSIFPVGDPVKIQSSFKRAVFGFMNPVFGVILSALLLNEKDAGMKAVWHGIV